MLVGAAHAFIDHIGDTHITLPLYIHANFDEHINNTGILTQRPTPHGTHP